jgi:hypothetical protein
VRPLLDDSAGGDDADHVGVADGGEPVKEGGREGGKDGGREGGRGVSVLCAFLAR